MAQILVVDDSSTVRDEVTTFLKNAGLDVISAVDGKDGLLKLKSDPGIKLVVADVNMPNMDGLTMVEKIRGELGNSKVNLIMLTTESSPNRVRRTDWRARRSLRCHRQLGGWCAELVRGHADRLSAVARI
jgi:two-component system chemotaxis response regulator CheY